VRKQLRLERVAADLDHLALPVHDLEAPGLGGVRDDHMNRVGADVDHRDAHRRRDPTEGRWRTISPVLGASPTTGSPRADVLGELVLPDHDGRPTRLGDLWADRPAVLVWLRHYG